MLKEIPTLEEIAGSLRSPDLRSVITADFVRRVRVACHPDRYVGLQADRERADTLRKEVERIAEELAKPPIVLKSGKSEYVLGRRIAVGDVADIYVATKSSDYKRYVIKVSRVAGGDPITNFIPPMIPKELKGFLRSCTLDGDSLRPQDAWGLLEEFDEMLFKVYGAPKFIELKLA